jgi:hypothetical protein
MEPAYHIPLTDAQLMLLGELCAIQGQIEYGMQQIVRRLEGISPAQTRQLMGANGMRNNAERFIVIVRNKCKEASLVAIAENAFKSLDKFSAGRVDFVHAIYGTDESDGFSLSFNTASAGQPVAVRTRNHKKTQLSSLQKVRDEAARISCAMAHIYFCLMARKSASSSPWLGKF